MQRGEAHLRQTFRKFWGEALVLGLDAPIVEVPQMDIQLVITDADVPLLKAFAPAIRCLSGDVLFQVGQLLRGKGPCHTAFSHTPELAVSILDREHGGLDFPVDAVISAVPVHQAARSFLRHTIFDQGTENVPLVATQHFAIQQGAFILHLAILVAGIEVRCQGHIQLQSSEFRRDHGEAVLPNNQGEAAAIVPLHVELANIVDVFQGTCAAGGQRGIRVFHLSELDPRTCGELFPQEVQPFFWC